MSGPASSACCGGRHDGLKELRPGPQGVAWDTLRIRISSSHVGHQTVETQVKNSGPPGQRFWDFSGEVLTARALVLCPAFCSVSCDSMPRLTGRSLSTRATLCTQ